MSTNLLQAVQQNLGYPELKKIDPNDQSEVTDKSKLEEDRFSQAAIPAVLTGLYSYVQSDENAADVLTSNEMSGWLDKMFPGNKNEVVQNIMKYAGRNSENSVNELAVIANEAVNVTKQNVPEGADIKQVKLLLQNQRHNILSYLPSSLHMGELLQNNTLDDNTNKMEGTVSSLMQNIGAIFSSPVTGDEIKPE